LHRRRRTWPSPLGRQSSAGRAVRGRCRTPCRRGDRTPGPSGRSRHSPCKDGCRRSARGFALARVRGLACGAPPSRCIAGDWRRSALACRPIGRAGNSCRAAAARFGARRSRPPA
jgi:hypothetical protein